MTLLAGLHPRWGQMLCFWGGGLALGFPATATEQDYGHERMLAAAVLMLTGLALKVIAVWKWSIERRAG